MYLSDELPTTTSYQKVLGRGCIIGGILFFMYFLIQQKPVNFIWKPVQVWYTPEQRIKRPTYINQDHAFCGPCPADKRFSTAWQLTDLVTLISPKTPFLLNIGAGTADGGIYDPTYPLLTNFTPLFSALLIDPSTNPSHFNAYPNRSNIHIIHDYIWSETIVENILQKYNISKYFTLLKVDIDSYECSLLQSILQSGYQPQIIHTEFNPIFAPPVIFIPIYNSTTKHDWKPPLWSNSGSFYGCSLSALSKLLLSFNYILVELDFWDVIYIKRDIVELIQVQVPLNDKVAYEYGFMSHSCFAYCRGNVKLYNEHIDGAIKSALNQSNFTEYMTNIIDLFAPVSKKTNLKHPYIISI
ncbi:unnamed protein product [Adineta steineri]|uniref:Methyltransferase FkbM domain-containing protein n=1 Tax=Adineta steineri TaxID=433720 RepID=A0A813Z708_9BILA|nr:unnamed protein product [Adineta steineri]CAF0894263.1 unnamed protein product [Adineta steineri]CAF3983898.1 unnamed protein product [Adineta steineri]CAF4013991.1 unnamed protein product [Adineta steineri]